MGIIYGYIFIVLFFIALSTGYCLFMYRYWKAYPSKNEKQKKRNIFFRVISVIILFKLYQKIAFEFFIPPIFLYNPFLIIFPIWIFSVTLRGIKGYCKLRNIFIVFLLLYPLLIIVFQKKKLNNFEQYCITDFPKQIVLNPEYLPRKYFHEVTSEEKSYYLQNSEFFYYQDVKIGDLLPNVVDLRNFPYSYLMTRISEMPKSNIYLIKCEELFYSLKEDPLLSLLSDGYYSVCEASNSTKPLPYIADVSFSPKKTFFVRVTDGGTEMSRFNYVQIPDKDIIAVFFKDYTYPWQYLGDPYRSCRKYYFCPDAVFPGQCKKYPEADYRDFFILKE